MCTFNGERFLAQQLNSILAQSHKNWSLLISDDGSTDATLDIVNSYRKKFGDKRIKIISGPCQGYAKNFLYALRQVKGHYDYFAFCDHDDIWLKDKLKRSVSILQEHQLNCNRPQLYCSMTNFIDENNRFMRRCHKRKGPDFGHSLVENIAGGNTMLFNKVSHGMLVSIPVDLNVVSHDWILYQLVSGAGGYIYYVMTKQMFFIDNI